MSGAEREWLCSIPGADEHEAATYAATRSKARYRFWLHISDYCPDIRLIDIRVRVGSPLVPPTTEWKALGVSERQREMARHALGFDGRSKTSYRNHYCIDPGGDSYDAWMDLVEKGLAKRYSPTDLSGGMDTFSCTGKLALAVRDSYEHLERGFR